VQKVAAALQISIQTFYRYVADGEIPFHKLDRSVRFKPSGIEHWVERKAAGVLLPGKLAVHSERLNENVRENAQSEGGEASRIFSLTGRRRLRRKVGNIGGTDVFFKR